MSSSRSHRLIRRRLAVIAAACAGAVAPASAMAQPADNGPIVGPSHTVNSSTPAAYGGPTSSNVNSSSSTPAAYGGPTSARVVVGRTPVVVPRHTQIATLGPDARDRALQASTEPASRPDPRSPDARDAALTATGQSPASVPTDLPTVVVHEHPSALPLALSIAALLIALAGWGFVVVRKTATKRQVPQLSH